MALGGSDTGEHDDRFDWWVEPRRRHAGHHRRGSRGDAVVELQRLLQKLGFMVAVDADFGPGTEVAVAAFQRGQKLDVDGIVGQKTWVALDAALKKRK